MTASAQHVRPRLLALELGEPQIQVVDQIRHPLRRDFDGADAQFGKFLWNAVEDHRMKAADHHQLGDAKRLGAEHFVDSEITDAGVNADRHVEPACLFVKRKKIRIVQRVIGFDSAHEHRAGAVAVRPAQFVERFVHGQERQLYRPAQALFILRPDIGHPAIVRATERQLDARIIGNRP